MNKSNSNSKKMGWISVSLCALCCTLPIIGAMTGIGSLTFIALYLEKIAILALGLAGIFFFYAYYQRLKPAKSCQDACETNCDCKPEVVE